MRKSLKIAYGVLLIAILSIALALAGVAAEGQPDDVQNVEVKVGVFSYPVITVEVDKPVRINFNVDATDLNSCNNEIIIPEWNIQKKLSEGDNFVEFTPTKTGTFGYSCWMNMIQSSITVIAQGSGETGAAAPSQPLNDAGGYRGNGGCCG